MISTKNELKLQSTAPVEMSGMRDVDRMWSISASPGDRGAFCLFNTRSDLPATKGLFVRKMGKIYLLCFHFSKDVMLCRI
jgi:hypothetical protein